MDGPSARLLVVVRQRVGCVVGAEPDRQRQELPREGGRCRLRLILAGHVGDP